MFCPNCGSQNNDSARFCSKCGKDLLSANSEDTSTGSANQSQDGTFNGTGLKYIHVVGTDGITRNFQVKWLPEEFDKMNPAQIVSALTEIYGVVHELTVRINKQKKLENECNQLEYDNMMPMDTTKLAGYGIALLVSVILYIAVGGLTVFLLIGGLLCFLYTVITEASAKSMRRKPYKNRYDAACKELDAAKRLGNDYIDQNAVILRSADTILPDYYYDENALAHMISSLKNRRATSLVEALNLFIADKNAMEQHQLMEDVEADSSGETEAGTTQRDVVRFGVHTISVSFTVTAKWLKKLTAYKQQSKIVVEFFDMETAETASAEMYISGYKSKREADSSYGGLWNVSFTLKEF